MNLISYILLAVIILLALAAMRTMRSGSGKKSCCRDGCGNCQLCKKR